MTLAEMRNLIRSELNETTVAITDAELNTILNDGYKDVASKALCYENKISISNITARVIPLVSYNVVRVNFVQYNSTKGMMEIIPQMVGNIPIPNSTPQFWFQWGDNLVIEPTPDVATYDLDVFASCYPSAIMSADSDTPTNLPYEFHESVYLFGFSFASWKLKRWADATMYYNRYIVSMQSRKAEYIKSPADTRAMITGAKNE